MNFNADCLIIGGGQAGGWAAAGLRQYGFTGSIQIISEEDYPPYERPPLSKQILAGEQDYTAAYLKPADFYTENDIRLRLNLRAISLDSCSRTVICNNGDIYRYSRLILATGTKPQRLDINGTNLRGIHYLRTISDVVRIKADLNNQTKVIIVGGGFIGLEVAAVASRICQSVTVIENQKSLLSRGAPQVLADAVQSLHASHGVTIRLGEKIDQFTRKDDVTGVVLETGEILPADIVVVGVGVVPNIEIAVDAGLTIENGILVNEYGETSNPEIFAVGDVANYFHPLLSRRIRLESWQNAQNQSLNVARVICGERKAYVEIPWLWSDQYDANLQFAGLYRPGGHEIIRGIPQDGRFSIFSLHDGRVSSVSALNTAKDVAIGKRLIAAGNAVDPALIADPRADLRKLLQR